MTALTANRNTIDHLVEPALHEFSVLAATHIYKGSFVGMLPTGYVRPFISGDLFVGIAYEEADNSDSSTDGDTTMTPGYQGRIKCWTSGQFAVPLTSAADTMIGKPVFATDSGACALYGHPDALIGFVVKKHPDTTNFAYIRLRKEGEVATEGCVDTRWEHGMDVEPTGEASSTTYNNGHGGLRAVSVLGLGVLLETADDIGALKLHLDNTVEASNATVETAHYADLTDGAITLEAELHVHALGGATVDVDWGIASLLDATVRADMDDGTLTSHARFHLDGDAADILAESDNNTTDTGAIDTTSDNVTTDLTGYKKFKVIARTDGTVEFYIDGARVLSTTDFAVLATDDYVGFVNLEKSGGAVAAEVRIKRFRFAAAGKAAA